MMKKNNIIKLPAFTLLELLVVLMLTGIVFSSAIMTYTNINKYILQSAGKQKGQSSSINFLIQLKSDFYNSDYINGNLSEIIIHSDSSSRKYVFLDNKVIITQTNSTDTIHIAIQKLSIEYIAPNIIKTITFNYLSDSLRLNVNYNKEYTAAFLFNNEVSKENKWE